MIAIDNVLISDEVVEEAFVCDLMKCKGGCCVDGDAGAPLQQDELEQLNLVFDKVKPYLTAEGLAEIEQQGRYVWSDEFGWVTPAINGGVCVYATTDAQGIVKCGIEQAYRNGDITWKKPISCHLFPIRIAPGSEGQEYMNYEPRPDLCKAGCKLGKKLKVPVYQFLKEPIERRYGTEFYQALQAIANNYYNQ